VQIHHPSLRLKYNDNEIPLVKRRKNKSKQHKKRLEKLHKMRDNLKSGGELQKTVAYKASDVVEKHSTENEIFVIGDSRVKSP